MGPNLSQKWEKSHIKTILTELKQAEIGLTQNNISKIIDYMSFKNRSQRDILKCPYYEKQPPEPCHDVKELNCFLCACPNYQSEKLEGGCEINSNKGKYYSHENLPEGRIWDCSDCRINHSPKEIEKYLLKNLEKLIKISEKL